MHARRARLERLAAVDDRGQRVVVDEHGVGRVAGRVAIGRDHHRDRLAVVADAALGQQRDGAAGASSPVGFEPHGTPPARPRSSAVMTATTPGMASAADVSMPVIVACAERRAHERRVQHARQHEVVDVAALAGDELGVLLAQDALADAAGGGALDDGGHSGPRHLAGRLLDRRDDVLVARAAAEVALQRRARISSSDSSPSACSMMSIAAIIIPGVQKPHWRPCCSWNARWIGCSSPFAPGPRPSDRRSRRPGRRGSSRTAPSSPSTFTVHAPHELGVASDVGAGQAQLLAQHVHEQPPRLHLEGVHRPVHRQRDLFDSPTSPPCPQVGSAAPRS